MRDRHVLCTGGTGALGAKVTMALVRRGARVTVAVHAAGERDRLIADLGGLASHVVFADADLREESQVAALVDGMPRLDALVQLVGGFAMGATEAFELEQYRRLVDVNLTVTFLTVKHALRRMKTAAYGRIVTVASRAAVDPEGASAVYSACKAAVLAFTRAVAEEHKGTGITANCVLPSIIDTPANRAAMGDGDAAKWVRPERLADTIAFLTSDEAGDLRGSAIQVYGAV
jgi:NAD(P)-dependent dehydrogenase (short-subunit alcohol dehydrogenase family)